MHKEPGERERILVQHDPTSVPNDLANAARTHRYCESPGSPFESLDDLDDQGDAEQSDENGIAREGRSILVDACRDRACVWAGQCAIGVGAIGDEAMGKVLGGHGGLSIRGLRLDATSTVVGRRRAVCMLELSGKVKEWKIRCRDREKE